MTRPELMGLLAGGPGRSKFNLEENNKNVKIVEDFDESRKEVTKQFFSIYNITSQDFSFAQKGLEFQILTLFQTDFDALAVVVVGRDQLHVQLL